MTIRAAIIGTGGISTAHAKALGDLDDRVQLVAAADLDSKRLAEFGRQHDSIHTYKHVEELLESERPDLVHICTPSGTHASLSIQALLAGAWVLCEKPMSGSLAELDQIEEAERQSGCYCSSVFQLRFGSAVQHLRELIERAALGQLKLGICNTTWYRGDDYYSVEWRGRWQTMLGGPTMTHGIHIMDTFLWLMGPWDQVRADMATMREDIEIEEISLAMVRFANGAMGSIVNSVVSPREENDLRLDFERCTLQLRHLYTYKNEDLVYTALSSPQGQQQAENWSPPAADILPTHQSQIAALLDCMKQNERPLTSGPEARRTIEFLTAMYKSAVTGQAVACGSIVPGDPFYDRIYGDPPPIFRRT